MGKEEKSEILARPSTLISNAYQTQNPLHSLAKRKHELAIENHLIFSFTEKNLHSIFS